MATHATPPTAIPATCDFARAGLAAAAVAAEEDGGAVALDVAKVAGMEGRVDDDGVGKVDLFDEGVLDRISFVVEVDLGVVWDVADAIGYIVFDIRNDDELGVLLEIVWVLVELNGSVVRIWVVVMVLCVKGLAPRMFWQISWTTSSSFKSGSEQLDNRHK